MKRKSWVSRFLLQKWKKEAPTTNINPGIQLKVRGEIIKNNGLEVMSHKCGIC